MWLSTHRLSLSGPQHKPAPHTVPLRPPSQSPPNFLHAASLAKHVKPVVVIPDEPQDDEDDDPEPLIEVGDVPTASSAPTQVPAHKRSPHTLKYISLRLRI